MSNKKYAKRIKRNQEKNGLKNGEYVVKNINDNRYEFECEGMDAVSKPVTISMTLRDAQGFLDEIHKKQPKGGYMSACDAEELCKACLRRLKWDFNGEEKLPEKLYERFAFVFRWAIAALQVVDEDKQKEISLSIWAGAASTLCNIEMDDFNTYFEKIGSNLRFSA